MFAMSLNLSNILLHSTIFLHIIISVEAFKRCDFAECNHEGECYENDNERWCSCIGKKYFEGSKCSDAIDNCQMANPCRNHGKCINVVGQFFCEDCSVGFGGLWCDVQVSGAFEKMLLYFNHYGYYGQVQQFLITVEKLGATKFSLEFVAENYAIASFETKPEQENKWFYSTDLKKVSSNLGLSQPVLAYTKGYYHIANETFWNVGLLELSLRSYDSESATKLLYQNDFSLLVLAHDDECVPDVRFRYGTNPLEPLKLDIASYNNFEILLKNRCFSKSKIVYYWSVYNSVGALKLLDFGATDEPVLKIPPYKLWFNYHDDVTASYILIVRMLEQYNHRKVETQARCFILVLPKPVTAIIKGGTYKKIGIQQSVVLDATNSRDFALDPNTLHEFFYTWNCFSEDYAENSYCFKNMGSSLRAIFRYPKHSYESFTRISATLFYFATNLTDSEAWPQKKIEAPILKIKPHKLQVHNIYNFTLSIQSKVNAFSTDQTYQLVEIMANTQMDIDIKCLRNCARHEFVEGDLIHLQAVLGKGQFSKMATFKWSLDSQFIGDNEHMIYLAKANDHTLKIQLTVQDGHLTGRAVKKFKRNLPPAKGVCSIEPIVGQALLTHFHIKCENYLDKDEPLSYEYSAGDGFPLQRTNEAAINTKLPQCLKIVVRICDQFGACISTNVTVTVREYVLTNGLQDLLNKQAGGLATVLEKGDILTGMVLLKTALNFIKSQEDLNAVIKCMEKFRLMTLLQLEQFLEIIQNLVINSLPLTTEKAVILNKYFTKLQLGFELILKDSEINSFKRQPYEKACLQLLGIMHHFAKTWQEIPAAQTLIRPTILSSNPLFEPKTELPDFVIDIAEQIENWLLAVKTIQDSFDIMAEGAKHLYAPWERTFTFQQNNISVQITASDNASQQIIQLNNNLINVTFSESCMREIQERHQYKEVFIEAASVHSNPFWWLPSEIPINSHVFLLKVFNRNTTKGVENLRNPFQFELPLNKNNFSHTEVGGQLKNNLHMPVYVTELPPNGVLLITFLWVDKPLRFLAKTARPARSAEVLNHGYKVKQTADHQSFTLINDSNKSSLAYMTVLLDQQFENVTFLFRSEILVCLHWDFSLGDAEWSSQSCKPKLEIVDNSKITCWCHHFSFFTATSYPSTVQEDLRDRPLLTAVPVSGHLVGLYFAIAMSIVFVLLYNLYHYCNHVQVLPIDSSSLASKDMEVCIFTGTHSNATSTANVTLHFVMELSSLSVTIYQNAEYPYLKRNSKCTLLISSEQVDQLLALSITSDQSGRYPSWFCHKITIQNLKTGQKEIFLIDQWICEKPLENLQPHKEPLGFVASFRQHLFNIYVNWFQFQALWGCWLWNDLNRLERCCIELSNLMASVCLLACYYGSTTLETYEEERVKYNFLNLRMTELFLLAVFCYLLNFLIKLIFHSAIKLFFKLHLKHWKNCKKIV